MEQGQNTTQQRMKFCKHCGEKIPFEAVICTHCGCQVEVMQQQHEQIVINNTNTNVNTNANIHRSAPVHRGRRKDKWVAFILCLMFGMFGAHKFYEGKSGMGLVYLFTAGLFGIGWIIDCIALLGKPNPYYVY